MAHHDNYKPDVPSVTELLKWAGYYKQYPNDEYYLERGSAVERWATTLLQGGVLEDDFLLTSRLMPSGHSESWIEYIDGFQEWRRQHKIKFIGAQIYVYNPWHTYQGTLDWLMWVDDRLTVVDCKTGSCPPFVKLQTAAYDMALSTYVEMFTPDVTEALRAWGIGKPRHRLGLQLQPGKCTPHEYDPKEYHRHNEDFRLLVNNWWKHGPQSREYR